MKICCTLGPKTYSEMAIDELVEAGMNIVRFNGTHIEKDTAERLIQYTKKRYPQVEILLDLQGHKLTISPLYPNEIKVHFNQEVIFCSEEFYKNSENKEKYIPVYIDGDFSLLQSASCIYMKDATMEFKIEKMDENCIYTRVIQGGIIRAEKGLNAPGMDRASLSSIFIKDREDILWGLKQEVNSICVSFASYKMNITDIQSFIKENSKNMPKILAKIETQEGIDNFESIIQCSDGIVVGRGDLAPEVGREKIPMVEDKILETMRSSSKELYIATDVLANMKRNAFPSVSEINDLYKYNKANVTGVWLCGETSVGRHPARTVRVLKKLLKKWK